MQAWIMLAAAGLFEIVWAIGLKYTDGFTKLVPSAITVVGMIGSVLLLEGYPPLGHTSLVRTQVCHDPQQPCLE